MPSIKIHNQEIEYQIKRTKLTRKWRLIVRPDASVVLTLPKRKSIMEAFFLEGFLNDKASWLLSCLSNFKKKSIPFFYKKDRDHYLKNKEKARSFIEQKVIEFCAFYNFSVPKISIKNQGTRWGSCSSKGNINFNYKILFMPKEMSDYIIVHELCHLKELNHSKNFWNLVAKFIPDYQKIRQDLKRISELSLNNQSFLVDTK